MLHLAYSNYTEALVDLLSRRMRRPFSSAAEALRPQHVVVPNRAVETYLKLQVSRRNGVVANVCFATILRFVRERLDDVAGTLDPPVRLVERDVLRMALIEALSDTERLAAPALAPVRRYLHAGNGEGADSMLVETRRFELASRLALLFEEYRFARPELTRAWADGVALEHTDFADAEAWQRALWLAVDGPEGLLRGRRAKGDARWVYLEQVFADKALAKVLGESLPPAVHVFGLSNVSSGFRALYAELAELCDVYLYALNPCGEYWEDVPRRRRLNLDDSEENEDPAPAKPLSQEALQSVAFTTDDPLPLQLWGTPGRETTRLLNALSNYDFDTLFVAPEDDADTVLARLQRDILRRTAPAGPPVASPPDDEPTAEGELPLESAPTAAPRDESVVVAACPSVQREVEIIAATIWEVMQADLDAAAERGPDGERAPLRFNDIAVLVPPAQAEGYLHRIRTVFAEAHDIPFNTIGVPAAATSRLVEALELLFGLPVGPYPRDRMLALLIHPNLAQRSTDVPVATWVRWCDALGIVHGADHRDHEGSYVELDVFNWSQGVRRLVLGAVMDVDALDAPTVELGENKLAPLTVDDGALEHVANFAQVVRGLIAETRPWRSERASLATWMRRVIGLIGRHIKAVEDGDGAVLQRFLEELEQLGRCDTGGTPLGYPTVHRMLLEKLEGLESRGGHALANGVVVSTLMPTRALPFQVVFVVGLDEGAFPARDSRSPLDLRAAERRLGDGSPRERDLYLFLETVVSTRRKLVLSYVARDEQTGEEVAPSTVVDDLVGILRHGYLAPGEVEALVRTYPLRRHEAVDLRAEAARPKLALPEAFAEAQVAALREDFIERTGGPPEGLEDVRQHMGDEAFDTFTEILRLRRPPSTLPAEAEPIAVRMTQLRQFLRSPVQGFARDRLGLADDSVYADLVAVADERFEIEAWRKISLLRDILLQLMEDEALEDVDGILRTYDARLDALMHQGHHPVGAFGEAQRRRDLRMLFAWRQHAGALGLAQRAPWQRVVYGRGPRRAIRAELGRVPEPRDLGRLHAPLELQVQLRDPGGAMRPVRVHVQGETLARCVPRAPMPAAAIKLVARDKVEPDDFLDGYVDHLVASAAGHADEHGLDVLAISTGRLSTGAWVTHFAPMSVEQARVQLTGLIGEMLSGAHAYLLPIQAVCEALLADPPKSLVATITSYRDDPWRKTASDRGPVRDVSRMPVPRDAEAIAGRRLGHFLSAVARRQPARGGMA